jgi:hypothetical protein
MSYIVQPDPYSCGPVALINLMEFYQTAVKIPLNTLIEMCNCGPPDGTYFNDFHRAIHTVCSKTKIVLEQIIFNVKYDQIVAHLSSGGAVILEFHWSPQKGDGDGEGEGEGDAVDDDETDGRNEGGEHYVLLLKKGSNFTIINSDDPTKGKPVTDVLSPNELKKYLTPYTYVEGQHYQCVNDFIYPKAYLFQGGRRKRKRKRL